jgi:putative intracellular protease/amidase
MADVKGKGRKVAVLATDGVEQVGLTEPVKALKQAGADVTVVSAAQPVGRTDRGPFASAPSGPRIFRLRILH